MGLGKRKIQKKPFKKTTIPYMMLLHGFGKGKTSLYKFGCKRTNCDHRIGNAQIITVQ